MKKTMLAALSAVLALSSVITPPHAGVPPVHRVLAADDVPRTLEECFVVLTKNLAPEDIERMRSGPEDDMVLYHHGLGTWIRNSWGLWKQGPLYQYFYRMGLRHPDDMSGVILTSFWRYLHARPLGVQEQVRSAQAYWRVAQEPPPGSNRACREVVAIRAQLIRQFPDGSPRVINIGHCSADGRLWAYEVDRGWYEPDEKLRAEWNDGTCGGCVQDLGSVDGPSNDQTQRTRPVQASEPRR